VQQRHPILGLSRRRAIVPAPAGLVRPASRPAAAAEVGLVSALRGTATASRGGETRTLHVGAAVHGADSLRTGEGARLLVTLADGSTLAIGERSTLVVTTITAATAGGGSMVFDLLAGIVRAVLGPARPDLFAVRGRVAVAAARSTDFVVETSAGLTTVFVAAGSVAVDELYGPGATELGQGQGIDVRRGVAIGGPRDWGRARIDDVLARTAVEG
jgi:ferric-dicitrate binding protein FerR (iron transport regulator)